MTAVDRRWRAGLAVCVLAALVSACEGEIANLIEPDPVAVTETFSGTLTPNKAESWPFSSSRGTVTATLLTVSPDSTIPIGLSLGIWNGLSCAVMITADKASQGTTVTGSVNGTGSLCVRLFDIGTITDPISYEVRVVHY